MTQSNQSGFPPKALEVTDRITDPVNLVISVNEGNKIAASIDKELTAGKFLRSILIASLVGITTIVSVNLWLDIYGLFLPVKGKELPIYNNERVSKYLLSYRYIPQNFNTAIIGTSLSANLDVSGYNSRKEGLRIYNASVMGANISEIKPIAENLVKGGLQNMIICFSPYMTKNSGSKEVEFGSKIYFGAIGSKNLYETYAVGIIRHFDLMPSKFPKNQIDQYGVNHYGNLFRVEDVQAKIFRVIQANENENLTMDPKALEELKELIGLLKQNNINFIGYFHPVPTEILTSKRHDYEKFEKKIRELVGDDNKLINFNTQDFEYFTTDYSNYIDHGHLSKKGESVVMEVLYRRLEGSTSK